VYPGRMSAPPKEAVVDLCLGIPTGECFGLLGVNGAGKTTTMSMLTGDFAPSAGAARLAGFDVATELPEVLGQVGYCPQFDALMDNLTGREMLHVFAAIKGVPEDRVDAVVEGLLSRVGLQNFAHNITKGYSGGNKRKLSMALALVGSPRLIFLDEPSSGMDPFARRDMWKVIESAKTDASVILTTHFMEEADALCARIGIMVNGRMRCIGSAQHLKSKYGSGYQMELMVDTVVGEQGFEAVHTFIQQLAPQETRSEVQILESHAGKIKARVPSEGLSLGHLFDRIEGAKTELRITNYSISQTTLEQVFLQFAKMQEEEQDN